MISPAYHTTAARHATPRNHGPQRKQSGRRLAWLGWLAWLAALAMGRPCDPYIEHRSPRRPPSSRAVPWPCCPAGIIASAVVPRRPGAGHDGVVQGGDHLRSEQGRRHTRAAKLETSYGAGGKEKREATSANLQRQSQAFCLRLGRRPRQRCSPPPPHLPWIRCDIPTPAPVGQLRASLWVLTPLMKLGESKNPLAGGGFELQALQHQTYTC